MSITSKIDQLPFGVITRMKLWRLYSRTASPIKKMLGRTTYKYYPMVINNLLYGDEFLLYRFCNLQTDDPLFSIIEHGLFLGRNHAKVGRNPQEWDLGCVLTPSLYRKETISEFFPEHYCETIGPMINYASIDRGFQCELQNHIDTRERTMLFYPVHSTMDITTVYNIEESVTEVARLADENDCGNIIICTSIFDKEKYDSLEYKRLCRGKKVHVSTNGMIYDISFLDRQRTMLSLADITVSNKLGTHVGYCIFFNKPHILLQQKIVYEGMNGDNAALKKEFSDTSHRSANWENDYKKEERMFGELFSDRVPQEVTVEQRRVCNYFWGFDQVKNASQIRDIWFTCKDKAMSYTKRHNV